MLVQSKSDYDIAVGYEFPNSKKLYVDFSFTINTDHRPGDSFDKSSVTIKSISINNLESTTHMNMSINELSKLFTNTFDKFSDTITGKSIAILKVDVEKCPEILKEVNFNE